MIVQFLRNMICSQPISQCANGSVSNGKAACIVKVIGLDLCVPRRVNQMTKQNKVILIAK